MAAAGVAAPPGPSSGNSKPPDIPGTESPICRYGVALAAAADAGGPGRRPHASLADAHAALQLADRAPLAVAIGAQRPHEGLDRLLTVWRTFAAHWPGAKLWLVGPMPDRRGVEERIERRQLAGRVTVVGAFDHLDDLFAAADLFVAPSPQVRPWPCWRRWPPNCPSSPPQRPPTARVLTDQQEGLLVPEGDAAALLAGIGRLWRIATWPPGSPPPPGAGSKPSSLLRRWPIST